jgi:hypothetical protein
LKEDDELDEFEEVRFQALFAMNEQVCYIENPGAIMLLHTMQLISYYAFKRAFAANFFYTPKINGNGLKKRRTVQEWIEWKDRNCAHKVVYLPGQPQKVDGCLNTWKPRPSSEVKGWQR